MSPLLIGLTGQLKSGKDTVADRLVSHHGFVKIGFADTIRREVVEAYGLTTFGKSLLENQDHKDNPTRMLTLLECRDHDFVTYLLDTGLPHADLASKRSPRWIQQRWGDYKRATAGWDYFIKVTQTTASEWMEQGRRNIVISGVRYAATAPTPTAEADMVHALGGHVVLITRPGLTQQDHSTELLLPDGCIDFTIKNNGSLNSLYMLADTLVLLPARLTVA
ncbi:hypothetical protein [Aquitalea magnusonii]|uniref:Dephospho-CoA kinase n=1 Tax=Aquitalea magnusonii TaxID=332411 RepID=A0A318JNE0_9NEIS|nr:hypothetical protein [Aquitalea magnusonii]PXX49404.1 hypothetical protein DFR38_10444 [Aquitalea magnusonii]